MSWFVIVACMCVCVLVFCVCVCDCANVCVPVRVYAYTLLHSCWHRYRIRKVAILRYIERKTRLNIGLVEVSHRVILKVYAMEWAIGYISLFVHCLSEFVRCVYMCASMRLPFSVCYASTLLLAQLKLRDESD